jgi:hypothetical protein
MTTYVINPITNELESAQPRQRVADKFKLEDLLTPGPLRDELKGDFDPTQETYEEYLRRINLRKGGRVNYAIGDLVYDDLYGQMGDAKLERARKKKGAVGKDERFLKRLSKGRSSYWPFKSNSVLITQSDIDNSFLVNNLIKKNKGFLPSPEGFAIELFGKTKAGKPVNLNGAMRALVIAMDNFKEAENFRFANDVYKNIYATKFNYLEMVAKSIAQSKNAKTVAESAAAFLPENMVTHYPKTLARGGEKGLFNIGGKIKSADKKFLIDRITKLTGEPVNLKQLDETLKFATDSRKAEGNLKIQIKRNAPMNADIKKLYDDPQISKLIRGNLNAANRANILKRAVKLIDDDVSVASRRLFQMAQSIAGTRDIPGIKIDEALGRRIIDTQRIVGKAGNGYAFSSLVYDHYGKVIDKALGATKGKSFIGYYQNNIAKALDAGLVPDEIFSVTASARRGMSPYAIFTQALTKDVNSRIKGSNLDSLLSKTHRDLQSVFKGKKYNQLNAADKKSANQIVKIFEDAKKDIIKKEGAKMKNVQLAEFDLKNAPSKSIANYKNLDKNLQKAFDDTYKKVGYSMKVPKEFKTQKQLLESLQKSKGVFKGAAKIGGKVLGPLGVVLGVSAVGTAAEAGESNLFDLASAYLTADPEVATTSRLLREDEEFKQEYIANLPEIVSDDQVSMSLAQGGRVGFQDGTPPVIPGNEPDYSELQVMMDNPNEYNTFPKGTFAEELDKAVYGTDDEKTLMQRFNQMFLDPRAYPYYVNKAISGAANIPEFAFRTVPALAALGSETVADLAADKYPEGKLQRFGERISPKITEAAKEKVGLTGLIEEGEKNLQFPSTQEYVGDSLQILAEFPGPITPFVFFRAAPKVLRQIKNLGLSATAIEKLNKKVEQQLSKPNQSRRDFLITTGAGGAVAMLKYLGLDKFLGTGTKVAEKAVVKSGGTPQYFFDFVNLIKRKGKDVSDAQAVVERQKVIEYKDYTLTDTDGYVTIRKTDEDMGRDEMMEYKPPEGVVDEATGKSTEVPAQYDEVSSKPDANDPGNFDTDSGFESIDEVLEELAKDGKTYSKEELEEMGIILGGAVKTEMAEGGIIAGVKSGPAPKSGPTPHGLPYVAKNVRPIKERK